MATLSDRSEPRRLNAMTNDQSNQPERSSALVYARSRFALDVNRNGDRVTIHAADTATIKTGPVINGGNYASDAGDADRFVTLSRLTPSVETAHLFLHFKIRFVLRFRSFLGFFFVSSFVSDASTAATADPSAAEIYF